MSVVESMSDGRGGGLRCRICSRKRGQIPEGRGPVKTVLIELFTALLAEAKIIGLEEWLVESEKAEVKVEAVPSCHCLENAFSNFHGEWKQAIDALSCNVIVPSKSVKKIYLGLPSRAEG